MNQILTKQIQLMYTLKVIPWGQTDKQISKRADGRMDGRMDGQIFTKYSGISSHSLMGVQIGGSVTDICEWRLIRVALTATMSSYTSCLKDSK